MFVLQPVNQHSQRPDSQTHDQHGLVPPNESHREASHDTKERERDGLGLHEVVRVNKGPGLDDDDKDIKIGESEVERELCR